jgi:hypothetical protein
MPPGYRGRVIIDGMPQTNELLWSVVLLTVIGVGALLLVFVARAYRKHLGRERQTQAFTIQDLRELRDAGDITQQEYEAMRAVVIGQATADPAASDAKDSPAQRARDADCGDEPQDGASDAAEEQ